LGFTTLLLILTGCTGDQPEEMQAINNSPIAQTSQSGSFFAIIEVGFEPRGYVTLSNFTDVPVSLGGLYMCQGSDCFALPDQVVEAGRTVRVAVGNGQGLENVVATNATIGELRPVDGEIAIFASANTDDPRMLLNYLEWGSTPHHLTEMAIERGLWLEGSYAPSGPDGTRLYRLEESGWWVWE
jgi:hypothetical protein